MILVICFSALPDYVSIKRIPFLCLSELCMKADEVVCVTDTSIKRSRSKANPNQKYYEQIQE